MKANDRGPAQHGWIGVDGQHGHAPDSRILCWFRSQGDFEENPEKILMVFKMKELEERPLTSLTMRREKATVYDEPPEK